MTFPCKQIGAFDKYPFSSIHLPVWKTIFIACKASSLYFQDPLLLHYAEITNNNLHCFVSGLQSMVVLRIRSTRALVAMVQEQQ